VGDYLAQVLPFLLKSSEPEAHSDVSNPGGHGTMGKPGSGAPSGGLDQRNIKAFEMSAGPAPQNEFNLTSSANGGLLPGFKYDPARAARFLLFSVFLATPVAHQWFAFLDKVRTLANFLVALECAHYIFAFEITSPLRSRSPDGMSVFEQGGDTSFVDC